MTFDGTLFVAYGETLRPLVVGVAISAVAGIGLGLWIGLSKGFEWLFSPIFIVMQAAPLAALIPILVMVYGIGLTSKVSWCASWRCRCRAEHRLRRAQHARLAERDGDLVPCA